MNTLIPMHFTANYLLNPTNPVTVNLIGAGGTGSAMLTNLLKIHHSLKAFDHPGLHVTGFDDDIITQANQGRQLFADCEVGLHKCVALINRINCFEGTNWKAMPLKYGKDRNGWAVGQAYANITISCVDTISARFDIADVLWEAEGNNCHRRDQCYYWLDCGNAKFTGQVVLSTVGEIKQPESKQYKPVGLLPMVTDEFYDLLLSQDETSVPSCSTAEALEKQDLFINPSIAEIGATLLWHLFRKGMTQNRVIFHNLESMHTTAIKVA
ncbi:PRTRC system ThiF family protein [Pedobacter nutrimenti]|uniref:PRTRC system ThiF family protein n=1 Tax=Pedobacter nutrimenti TaxID=1241337 RepID=UPI002930BB8F|nr:PRTRC system ThiF family protein [Pedobacter nutrimenti]